MKEQYLPVGNEYISIPRLNQANAAIEDVTFLHMASKGMIELRGAKGRPLMVPFVEKNGAALAPAGLAWTRDGYWPPQFDWTGEGFKMTGTILPPVGEKGFIYRLVLENTSNVSQVYSLGLTGTWFSARHCVNEDKEIGGSMHVYESGWNDSLVFDMRCGLPLFSFAPMTDLPCRSAFHQDEGGISYRLSHEAALAPGRSLALSFFWGFGYEEVAAATSAKDMLRQGFDLALDKTRQWLAERACRFEDKALERFYNTNLFFCIFFSTGLTLDTEELVLVTSRSPRYYVSAAYWDRDSLLWSFPAVLDADAGLAGEMLSYAFGRQRRNIGTHSRYIDGTVLEPGFELDELMAPVIALDGYVEKTGDTAVLSDEDVKRGIREILKKLEGRRHEALSLYSTFLQPTDDEIVYPYLTYDNVLVWKGLRALGRLIPELSYLEGLAENIKNEIYENCVKEQDGKRFFAWSVDLRGQFDVYDEPPGSLLLLPYLGFCAPGDEIYKNTVNMIRSPEYAYSFSGCGFGDIGCPHAPHPWLLSVANSLLSGRVKESLGILSRAGMDNGIVCESIDEHTGECATGEAFATCAGFVCHALRTAIGRGADER